MQRLNHFIQNRSNRTIKMSVNAVKTTRLRRASLGIVRSITPLRRNGIGIGTGVEGSWLGEKHENHLSTRSPASCFDGQRAGIEREGDGDETEGTNQQPGEVGDGGPLQLGALLGWWAVCACVWKGDGGGCW